jgi:hypothetical protein
MATCPNCKKSLSCGCQLRKAKDGTNVCTSCLPTYNSKVTKPGPSPVAPPPTDWSLNRNK